MRLLSFAIILTLAFLRMVSVVFGAALSALGEWWGSWFIGCEVLAHVIDPALSFGTIAFAVNLSPCPDLLEHGSGDRLPRGREFFPGVLLEFA